MLSYVVLLIFVSNVQCFTPNCVPENQFKFYRFPVYSCSENFEEKCRFQPSGHFQTLGDASLVKIGETEVLPTCAFYNAEGLKRIYGVNSKIKILASGSFADLPNLEGIHLAFNAISEVRKDIFRNVSVETLDLSWNKIAFIDSHAFAEIRGLKTLNLSRNSLGTVPINFLPSSLSYLNLKHNLLSRIALNSNNFHNLTIVDLSNNLIEKIAILFSYPVDLIDFTSNRLEDFDYIDIPSVNLFKIGRNQFVTVPRYLENLNAKIIDLYPNPWKCDELFLLWQTLVSFNIRLAPKESGKTPPAECFKSGGIQGVTMRRSNICSDDHECPDYMACRAKKCWDPCDKAMCHESSVCKSKHHQFTCSCDSKLLSDPLDIHGKCQKVECFVKTDCSDGALCSNHKCTRVVYNEMPYSTTPFLVPQELPAMEPSLDIPAALPEPELPWWFEDIPRITPNDPSEKATI